MKKEPVMTLVVALIAAAGGLLAAFGVNVTDAQVAALSTFAVAALGLGVWVRSKVRPTAKAPAGPQSLASERGQAEPFTLLIYVIVVVILVLILLKVLDHL